MTDLYGHPIELPSPGRITQILKQTVLVFTDLDVAKTTTKSGGVLAPYMVGHGGNSEFPAGIVALIVSAIVQYNGRPSPTDFCRLSRKNVKAIVKELILDTAERNAVLTRVDRQVDQY